MVLFLLLHEKMKLLRTKNRLTLKQLRMGNSLTRMQNKIDKRNKYYDKLKKQIERQANCYKNSANIFFSNQMGLGCGGVNLNNMYGSSMAAIQALGKWGDKDPMGNPISQDDIAKAQAYMAGQYEYKDGKYIFNSGDLSGQEIDKDGITKYQQISQMANSQVTQMQSFQSQMKSNYENNVSIWQEAAIEQIEAQQEYELDLLSEEQADMEADKNSIELQLQVAEERLKAIEQKLGQAVQDATPKFGIG